MRKGFKVDVAGHPKELKFSTYRTECGHIDDGVDFWFEGEGCWTVSIEELKRIVNAVQTDWEKYGLL